MFNPFSTKFWSPGVFSFQFSEPGETLNTLLQKSLRLPICQIVGQHGTGKTTLLLGLLKHYQEKGEKVRLLSFNDQHRRIPDDLSFQENQILFADGMEWLRFWDSFHLLFLSKRLIFTVHRPKLFIPILYRTKPQFSVFVQLVRQMKPDQPGESVLQKVYDRSGGNFRNAFF
jgi:ABC-type cobalamin/Fe3+-siderophores transport system ATPase subunit